jgi:hypothetical protein
MSKARQPAWPLARHGSVDLFRPVPFGTDQRSRFVTITLMFVSVVIGSIPRMGKTFLLRLLGIIAALDVRRRAAPLRPERHRGPVPAGPGRAPLPRRGRT